MHLRRVALALLALTLGTTAVADERFTYIDGLYEKTRVFTPTSEILVRFDGDWAENDVAAFASDWSLRLTDDEGYVPHLRYGVFRPAGEGLLSPEEAVTLAATLETSATRRLAEGASGTVRAHVGLDDHRGRALRLVPGQVMIQLETSLSEAERETVLAHLGSEVLATFWTDGYLRISVPDGRDHFDFLREANTVPGVRFAGPDVVGFNDALFVPDDALYPQQWALNNTGQLEDGVPGADVNAEKAWDVTLGDPDVVVVVIDNGVDLDHPDLAASILARPPGHDWDFTGPDSTGNENTNQHGTHVASGVSAVSNNGIGVAGMAPGASMVPLKIQLSSDFVSQRVDAMNYAASWGTIFDRVVINSSWKVDIDDAGLQAACDNAAAVGCLVVVSAGNDGEETIEYPAIYPSTMAIGFTREDDSLDSRSHTGPELDLVAPGNDILGCIPGGGYDARDGSSEAAPIVSGTAALLWSLAPNLTAEEIRQILRDSADDQVGDPAEDTPGFDIYHGHGRLNAYQALLATGLVQGRVEGSLRAVTSLTILPDDSLAVDPDQGVVHHHVISNAPVDAQTVDDVHVRGIVTLFGATDLDTTVVQIGLVTAAQRDRALFDEDAPPLLVDQGVFARVSVGPGGPVIAPADHDADVLGGVGVGEAQAGAPAYTFDLWLAPSDSTGGVARLSVNGGAYGAPHPYGVDNETALGGEAPAEDFSQAYLVAQIVSEASIDTATVHLRNVRVETEAPGWGDPLAGSVRVFETGEQLSGLPSGVFGVDLDAFVERNLIFNGDHAEPDTVAVNVAHGDTLVLDQGLVQLPRGEVRGRLRAVTEIGRIDDATLQVNVGSLGAHALQIVNAPVDAQGVDSVHVSGIIELHDLQEDVDDVELQLGLVTAAQRDSALVIEEDPALLFDQGVFVHYALADGVRQMAPGDFAPDLPGAAGDSVAAAPILAFDLQLVPSDSTGGVARLSVNGAPYGAPHPYGIDDGTAQGGSFPGEDFSEAYLAVQLRSTSEVEATARVRNLRVETIAPGFGEPLEGTVTSLSAPGSVAAGPDGGFVLGVPAELEQTLAFAAPGTDPDTLSLRVAHADSIFLPVGLRKFPRAYVRGALRATSGVITLADDTLSVGEGVAAHDVRLTPESFDAQSPDTVRVTGTIQWFGAADLDTTVVEVGLVTTAQRDSALVTEEDPALLFDQGVFARLWMSASGMAMAPGDRDAGAGGVGDTLDVATPFTFELVLVPSDTTGGSASLSVDGGPPGALLDYGIDAGGETFPREDFTSAVLVAQARANAGPGGTVFFRNVRVELVAPGTGGSLVGSVTEVESGEFAATDGNGAYLISPASMEPRRLAYVAEGYLPDTLTVELVTDDTLFVPVGLAPLPSGAVTGTVTFGPTDPLPDVEVRYRSVAGTVLTGGDGTYALPSATIGTYDLRFASADYGPRHVREFEVLADSIQVLDLDLLAGFDDDLELGAGAWSHLPGGEDVIDEWHVSGQRNYTAEGDSAWKCGGLADTEYMLNNHSVLEMPPVVVQPDDFLTFQHWIDAPVLLGGLTRQGGRVEASTDSGMVWTPLNPVGGYPFRTPGQYMGPFGADAGLFAGSHDWRPAEFALAGFVGDTLWVRLVFAADSASHVGEGWYVDDVRVSDARVIAVDDADPGVAVARPFLFQNVPNPFNPTTRIGFELPREGVAVLTIYDVSGRRVRRLLHDTLPAGRNTVSWDGRDDANRALGSGIYYYELRAADEQLTRRMLLLK